MTRPLTGLYVSGVAYKIRILASNGRHGRESNAMVVYRVEAYEEGDELSDRKWICSHSHESMEHAIECGAEWLERNPTIV